jgi:peptidoglycan hydrolase-like protein with peptidoglycan-binding domain
MPEETMNSPVCVFVSILAAGATLLTPLGSIAGDEFTSLHPEAAYPDTAPPLLSPGPYAERNKQVQQKLHDLGFDAGPVNGDFGSKTQAALAQFQISRDLPASGSLDDRTLAELGVERESQASAGASTVSSSP